MGDKGARIPWAPCRVTGLLARANPSKAPVRADALASADPAPQSAFMDLPFPLPVTRRVRRASATLATTAAAGVVGSLVLAGPAQAAAGCTTTTPTLDQLISCVTAGSETITIPVGANRVEVVVIGGGGGGGGAGGGGVVGAAGGAGASVSGTLIVSSSGAISVVVGAPGAGGSGGIGGSYSSLSEGGALLVVAGGGGGGGFSGARPGGAGGVGALGGVAAGGDGADQGTSTTNGGSGGSGGVGGAAGAGATGALFQGKDWSAGGDGGVGDGTSAGYGGSGYGGGGGGGTHDGTPNAKPGGGAGGSYANPTLLIGAATYAPATGSAGQGGAGAPLSSGANGSAGTAGSITLILRYVADSSIQAVLLPAAQLQQVPMPRTGSCSDVDESRLDWGSTVTGGWSASWAEWANGAVCTRTFTYDSASGSWRV